MMFLDLFKEKKPILGMLHLTGDSPKEKRAQCLKEAAIYKRCGVDGMIVEDYFGSRHDVVDCLKALAQTDEYVLGVNVLDNFSFSYEAAALYGGCFVQVDSAAGHLPPALDRPYGEMIAAYRRSGDIQVIGGVRFKYQPILSGRTLEEDMRLGLERCDAIACTGEGTGLETTTDKIRRFRELMGDYPLVVAAGMTPDTVGEKLAIGDAAIVGSYFKEGHVDTGLVNEEYVKIFMDKVFRLREEG